MSACWKTVRNTRVCFRSFDLHIVQCKILLHQIFVAGCRNSLQSNGTHRVKDDGENDQRTERRYVATPQRPVNSEVLSSVKIQEHPAHTHEPGKITESVGCHLAIAGGKGDSGHQRVVEA
eukprot:1497666-Rhodomonas_salina.2